MSEAINVFFGKQDNRNVKGKSKTLVFEPLEERSLLSADGGVVAQNELYSFEYVDAHISQETASRKYQ
ncbi:MAG: LEPR-XLL domain-containing protein [Thermoguttaceae bacterium]|nr:LEPR-XLL domain-containing protein [Thermoguttaceae bacterium]